MNKSCYLWKFALLTRIWLLVMVLGLLSACGGGGGEPSASTPATLSGQVVKGLTSGATVTLFSLTDSGQKTVVASALTNAQGEFNLGYDLQSGHVYLLEALGGTYVNEISDVVEQLTSPIRAVFVASGNERNFAINAISEAVALEVERSAAINKWSASAVANATTLINTAFDLPSPFDLRFIDLTKIPSGTDTNLSNEETAFSFHIGVFAGLLQELRLRSPSLTLTQGMQKFHAEMRGVGQDDSIAGALIAGVIRFVEKVPRLSVTKSSYFSSIGLPSDANSARFTGAESSGQSLENITNWQLRLLGLPGEGEQPTTDTVFNSRGALVAYRQGTSDSGVGFSHVGYASVADVYGTAETAIGRWNRGYYYRHGVEFDAANQRFVTRNGTLAGFDRDMVYAAGIPATNMPACGTVVMAPQAQTKTFLADDNTRQITLDASSRIAVQSINGTTLYRYNIVLRDDLGSSYVFSTPSNVNAPFEGYVLPGDRIFRAEHWLTLPSGKSLDLKGMIAGNGGTKAVIMIGTNIHTNATDGLAAAFAQVSSSQDCKPVTFSSGAISPTPDDGEYQIHFMNPFFNFISAKLFDNGTPNFDAFGGLGVTAGSGVEQQGNNLAGIGILMPPFSMSGNTVLVPQTYIYLKSFANSVYPQNGSASYRLVASTPFVIRSSNQLISTGPNIQSAELTIFFDQNPLGSTHPWYGTCLLTVNGQTIPSAIGDFYYRDSGSCSGGASGLAAFRGGISSGDGRYAVFKYIKDYSTIVRGEASLLFEKLP